MRQIEAHISHKQHRCLQIEPRHDKLIVGDPDPRECITQPSTHIRDHEQHDQRQDECVAAALPHMVKREQEHSHIQQTCVEDSTVVALGGFNSWVGHFIY